jgi:RNA polymerase sigma-70 factor (ECF subfamily)
MKMTVGNFDDAVFGEQRPVLFGLAYRMLGSVADAEDVVQEAFLRWQAADRGDVQSPRAFLTTVATRLAVDQLRRRQRERETYIGPWLPEPLVTDDAMQESRAELAESLSLAFLTLLEKLQPLERAVFLLHDVFQYSHDEIAAIVEKSPENCRQILARAKQHLAAARPRFRPEPARQQALLEQFLATCQSGDVPAHARMLVEDVVLMSDGGGKVQAARKSIRGPDMVARALVGLARKTAGAFTIRFVSLNGARSVLLCAPGGIDSALNLEFTADGRIAAVHIVRNPEKLGRLSGGGLGIGEWGLGIGN